MCCFNVLKYCIVKKLYILKKLGIIAINKGNINKYVKLHHKKLIE